MKSISLLCVAIILGLTPICQAQSWSFEYGKGESKVAFYNRNSDPDFAEDAPYGPMSFRVKNSQLWLLDSLSGKLDCFNKDGKKIKSIPVPGIKDPILLEDFAIEYQTNRPTAVWIANAPDCLVKKISLTNGKVLAQVGGNGETAGKILQVQQLEVDKEGRLYVGDVAKNKISVFTSTGSFLREINWQPSGFIVDDNSNLHLLYYTDNLGYSHRVYSSEGQLLKNIHLGFVKNTNAKILSVDQADTIIISMIPKDGFKGSMLLYKVSKNGNIIEKLEYIPPTTMNRDVYIDGENIFQAEADFETAPRTKFLIKPLTWEKRNLIMKKITN